MTVGFDAGVGCETNDDDLFYQRIVGQVLGEGFFEAVFLHWVRIGIINIVKEVSIEDAITSLIYSYLLIYKSTLYELSKLL